MGQVSVSSRKLGSVGEFGAVVKDGDISSSEESQSRLPKLKASSLKAPRNGECKGSKGIEQFLRRDDGDVALVGETGADCDDSNALGLGEKIEKGFFCITAI